MPERYDEVDLKISLGFIGSSKKPFFADETISVKVPVDCKIGKLVNEVLRQPSEISSSTYDGSINTVRFRNKYVKSPRSNKNVIRAILPRSNQPSLTSVSVKQAGLKNGDTLRVIFPKEFSTSLPGKPVTPPRSCISMVSPRWSALKLARERKTR